MKLIARKDAKQAGKTRYFTGLPCKHGHVAERFVSTRWCVECSNIANIAKYRANPEAAALKVKSRSEEQKAKARETARRWKQQNKERCKEYLREWKSANPGRHAETTKAWKQANADAVRAAAREWAKANRGKANAWAAQHYVAKMNRTPVWSDLKAIEQIYQEAREFREYGLEVDVDHIIPLQGEAVSGLHVPANLRVCLSSVNRSKSNSFSI